MLDRIDIHIEVPRVDYEKLSSDHLGELSAATRERQHFLFFATSRLPFYDVKIASA
jgi:hypothetical protein